MHRDSRVDELRVQEPLHLVAGDHFELQGSATTTSHRWCLEEIPAVSVLLELGVVVEEVQVDSVVIHRDHVEVHPEPQRY